MNVQNARWLLVTIFVLVVAAGCSPAASLPSSRSAPTATPPPPMSLRTPASQPSIDYVTLEAEIEKAITAGPATLDKVRAVLVNVDGETKIAHYRHGFTEDDHGHVFSVTKSVLSILIGIAIEDDLIADIDQPLVELLPKHRDAMSSDTAKVTLRHLMTMSGGFNPEFPNGGLVWEKAAEPGSSLSTYCSGNGKTSNPARPSGTPIAVLTSWPPYLRQPWNGPTATTPGTVLDYARQKLFNPLGISTHPSSSQALPDLFAAEFVTAGLGWWHRPQRHPPGRIRSSAHCAGHDENRRALPEPRSLERRADCAVRLDPTVHFSLDI